jgi:Rad3-related DNA helicase
MVEGDLVANKTKIRISVRNLVEFIFRSGDIDSQFMSNSRALEGTKAHQKVQKKNEYESYLPEVSLKHEVPFKGFSFSVEGRADGIITDGGLLLVDEIKSTSRPIELIEEDGSETHWAQAKCYAYIYCVQNSIESIGVQLTYCQLETDDIKRFRRHLSLVELEEFFFDLLDRYLVWAALTRDWTALRNASIRGLDFPFESYRKGQRELAVSVYRTIAEGKKIFVQAPTGTGKTISTLFPAVKAVGEGHVSKIFYLTAKTIVRGVAEEALAKMKDCGLELKAVTLTAKDKICFKEKSICSPDHCEYAKGHFDRANDALLEMLRMENSFTRQVIEVYARKHRVCPFELSLDLTLWADCVICDYNYVFDPRVYLRRLFSDAPGDYAFLIDEAHNLVDRARDMFSAELSKRPILELKKKFQGKEPGIAKALNKLNSFMVSMRKLAEEEGHHVQESEPKDIYPLLMKFMSESEEWLAKNEESELHEDLLELYFNALGFMRTAEFYDERYITYADNSMNETRLKLFCLDPSFLLRDAQQRGKASVFFSATLTPIEYYTEILGGGDDSYRMSLPSPFDVSNRELLIADNISTKFRNRERTYASVAESIRSFIGQKRGNYIAYFPSYRYMNEVHALFSDRNPEIRTIVQSGSMTEAERESFLGEFHRDSGEGLLGFCVLGGVFSEGVDLKHDELIGAVIVGVGLPQLCFERDVIKDYFNRKNGQGYDYSYVYPGMNKVLQAAGRVIRTETDRGAILLIDERFGSRSYQQLFPGNWFPHRRVRSVSELEGCLSGFWHGYE